MIHTGQAAAMPRWKVAGVTLDSATPFVEDVEAESDVEAKKKIEGTGKKTKVVALVEPA